MFCSRMKSDLSSSQHYVESYGESKQKKERNNENH